MDFRRGHRVTNVFRRSGHRVTGEFRRSQIVTPVAAECIARMGVTTLDHAREAWRRIYVAAELRNPICVYAYMVNGPEAAPSTMAAPTTQPTFNYDADRPFTRE